MARKQVTHSLPVASFLLQPTILTIWVVGSLMTWMVLGQPIRSWGGLFAGILYISFLLALIEYGMDIVEQTARGVSEAPSFSKALSNSDSRLMSGAVALAIGFAIISVFPDAWSFLPMMALLAIAPAVMSSITFYEPLTLALNPIRIYQFMSNMGISYISLRAVTTSVGIFVLYAIEDRLGLLDSDIGRAIISGILVALVLMMLRATGALLHIRRQELGIQTLFSEEQAEATNQAARDDEWRERLAQINLALKADSFKKAWSMLDHELQKHKYQDEARVYELLKRFDDRRLLQRLGSVYISHLLPELPVMAMEIFDERWEESSGKWKLHSGALVIELAKRADTNKRKLALHQMLSRFPKDFPEHPRSREAALVAARLAAELNRFEVAQMHLKRVDQIKGHVDEQEVERIRRLTNA